LRPLAAAHGPPAGGSDHIALAVDSRDGLAHKAAAENFPVALRLLPRRHRAHLMAVYNFARTVDDIGDEAPSDQRLSLLDELDDDLARLYASGQASTPGSRPRFPAVLGLAEAVTECAIPEQCFRDLIDANRQDQVVTRYETFGELLGYCTLSANPVGRIVLSVFGCSTPERAELSDAICSGLQVVEHLQDVAEDFQAGRVYLPAADMRSYGCTEADLAAKAATPQLRRLIAVEARRAAALIDEGAPLVGQLRGAARIAIAGYIAGGRAAIAAIADADYDVLTGSPKPTKSRTARELAVLLVRGR
jgi:squalene synthase HpnC